MTLPAPGSSRALADAAKVKATLISGAGDPEIIQNHIRKIRKQIDEATSKSDKEKLQECAAKLSGGVAVIAHLSVFIETHSHCFMRVSAPFLQPSFLTTV